MQTGKMESGRAESFGKKNYLTWLTLCPQAGKQIALGETPGWGQKPTAAMLERRRSASKPAKTRNGKSGRAGPGDHEAEQRTKHEKNSIGHTGTAPCCEESQIETWHSGENWRKK
jgi:hypothetical protein